MTQIPTTCTYGPSAVTGERCGQPAVTTFTGADGTPYAECAEHAGDYAVNWARQDEVVPVVRHGKVYMGTVTKVTRAGNTYAEIIYDNGVKRTVRV